MDMRACRADDGGVVGAVSTDQDVHDLRAGEELVVGRDASCDIQIGHRPVYDDVVPRRACRVRAVGDRLLVTNLSSRLAFDVVTDDRPPMVVRPGDCFSPPHRRYDVVISGGAYTYPLTITRNTVGDHARLVRNDADLATREPLTGARPDLTERQRQIIDLYTRPVCDGSVAASHQEVADVLGISRSLVRLESNRIWSELLLTGVPMRDLPDKRDAIVDAWTRHRF